MTKDEALKMALEALEHESEVGNDDAYRKERDAIKEALAQPDQESDDLTAAYMTGVYDGNKQRTWVGLTDKDKHLFSSWLDHKTDDGVFTAIEAKLKEKNT